MIDPNYDAKIKKCAENIILISLALKPNDRFLLVIDRDNKVLGSALLKLVEKITKNFLILQIESYGHRPILQVTQKMEEDIAYLNPTASVLVVRRQPGEETLTTGFANLLAMSQKYKSRHIHMPTADTDILADVGSRDMQELIDDGKRIHEKLTQYRDFRVTTLPDGELYVTAPDKRFWYLQDGVMREPGWKNFPDGEDEFLPISIRGTFRVASLGLKAARKYGVLSNNPPKITVVDNRAEKIECYNATLQRELEGFLLIDSNGRRIGEFSIGFNKALKSFTGDIAIDEKRVGVHIAMGHPHFTDQPGGYQCVTHMDAVGNGVSLWGGTELLIDNNKLLI